jgi:hypothetical protein
MYFLTIIEHLWAFVLVWFRKLIHAPGLESTSSWFCLDFRVYYWLKLTPNVYQFQARTWIFQRHMAWYLRPTNVL